MMTRTATLRSWTPLALAAALACLSGCAEQLTAPQLIERAALSSQQGRHRAAIIDLRNAVSLAPDDATARYRLAAVSLLLGDAANAEKELRRARESGYDVQSTIPEMAEALILLGRPGEALAEIALTVQSTAELEGLRGLAYELDGDSDRALQAYSAAHALDGMEERALLGKARFALAKGDRKAAEQGYFFAVAEHGESATARLEYGRFLYAQGDAPAAAEQFRKALTDPVAQQHVTMRWDLNFALAEAHLSLAALDEAEAVVETLNQIRQDHVLVKYLRARLAFERRELTVAGELTDRVRVEVPEFMAAQLLDAAIKLAQGEHKMARLLLEELAVLSPTDAQVRKLLAAARQAESHGAIMPEASTQAAMMSLLGSANAQTGDYTAAVTLWERLLEEDPSDQDVRLELVTAYLVSGHAERAEALLSQGRWSMRPRMVKAAVLDTLLSMRTGAVGEARRKATAAAQHYPDSAQLTSLRGLIELRRDPALASSYFKQALALDPGHTMSLIGLSHIAVSGGDLDRAVAMLRSFVDQNPQDAIALDALGRAQLREGDVKGAQLTLERAREADPQAVAPRMLLVDLLSRSGKYLSAEVVARELIAARPTLAAAHNSLGAALMGQGKIAEGTASLRAALRIDPTALDALRNLARAELASNARAHAQQTVAQLLAAHPEDPVGLELAARLAIGEGRLEDAEQRLSALSETGADDVSSVIAMLRGDIARRRGQPDAALAAYEAAADEALTGALVMRLYHLRRQLARAQPEAVLRAWLADHPEDQTVRFAAAQYAQSTGDLVTATLDYERMLDVDPHNVIAWNNLAWAYSDAGDFRALETAKRALDLATDSPAVQDTYGWMLVLEGQLDNGVSMLRTAWEAAPAEGNIGYHLGEGLVRSGETEQARQVLAQALERGGDFTSRQEAQALLARL